MIQNNYVSLLDPSIINNMGDISNNLGDLIIFESVRNILKEIFPGKEIIRISTHSDFTRKEKEIIKNAEFTFVGGSNLLTSNIRHFKRFTPVKKKCFYLFPGFKNAILLGAGWCEYEPLPDWATRIYYHRILSQKYIQSVRDSYSAEHLKKSVGSNVLNTSCPTTWKLDPLFINKFQPQLNNILFTVNGFYNDPILENKIIDIILQSNPHQIYFFPQTLLDIEYIQSLEEYKKNKSKFTLLDFNYQVFLQFINTVSFNYIGSRLHGGIKCLQKNMPVLVLGFDNRSFEIKRDIRLNVIDRSDLLTLQYWIHGKYIPENLNLPMANINSWKSQFVS